MKKSNKKIREYLSYLTFAASALAPIAIAVSCGESGDSDSAQSYREKFADALGKVTYFAPDAINTKTKPKTVKLDPIAKEYKYLSGAYGTLAAAKDAPEAEWKSTLPTSVAFDKNARSLWLKVTPLTLSEIDKALGISEADIQSLSGDNQYFDLTTFSNVQKIKSDIADTNQYREVSLAGVIVAGTVEAPVVTGTDIALPDGSRLELLINNVVIPASDLVEYIKSNAATMTAAVLANAMVRVGVTDDKLFVIEDSKTAPISSSIPFVATVDGLVGALGFIKANLTTSNDGQVMWLGLAGVAISKPSDVEKVEYYTGIESSEELIGSSPSVVWSNSLPTTLNPNHQPRNLWAKLTVKSGASSSQRLVNLTESSGVRSVKTLISPALNELATLTISGSLASPVINNLVTPAETSNFKVEFKIKDNWFAPAAFIQYIKDHASEISAQDLSTVKAHYAVANSVLYKLGNAFETPIVSTIVYPYTPTAPFMTRLNGLKAASTSNSAVVTWDGLSALIENKPVEIAALQYYSGPLATIDEVSFAPATAWSNTLPKTVAATHGSRHLFVRLVPASGYAIATPIIDLTDRSDIKKVKTLVTPVATNLSVMSLSGPLSATVINNLVSAPENAKLQFQIKTQWIDADRFTSYLSTNASTITSQDMQSVKARYQVLDPLLYVLDSDYEAQISMTNTTMYVPTAAVITSINSLAPTANSLDASVAWTKTSELAAAKPAEISAYKYYYGTISTIAAVQALPDADWSADLPNVVSEVHGERNLFIKLVPAEGISIASPVIDLTSSSGIRSIKTAITPPVTNLAGMSLSGSLQAMEIKNLVTAPENAKIQIKLKDTWVDSDQLATYASTNAATITVANLQSAKAQYAVLDASLFALLASYEVAIGNDIKMPYTPDSQFTTNLNNIKASLTTSKHTGVVWTGLGTMIGSKPAAIAEVKFYSGALATIAEIAAASESVWVSTLPTTVDAVSSARHLFARLTPAAGYTISSPYIDLISSSDIQNVRTVITTQPLALSTISYKVIDGVTTVDTKGITAPANMAIQYEFNGDGTWRNQPDFIRYVNGLTAAVAASAYRNVKARLAPESSLYVLDNDRAATIQFSSGDTTYKQRLLTKFAELGYFTNDSISSRVTPMNFTIDNIATSSYEYLYGDYTSLASAKSAPATKWSTSKPTAVDFDKSKRSLWMRVSVKTPVQLGAQTVIRSYDLDSFNGDEKFVDVTSDSRIRSIRSDIAKTPEFASYSFGNVVSIGGRFEDPFFYYGLGMSPLPGTKFVFRVGAYTYSEPELSILLTTKGSDTTRSFLGSIKLELAVDDTGNYALSETKQLSVSIFLQLPPVRNLADWNNQYPEYVGKIVGTKVVDGAFAYKTLPNYFALPPEVTEIGNTAFQNAILPTGFALPAPVRKLGNLAFAFVNLPTGFTIPAGVVSDLNAPPFKGAKFKSGFVIPAAMTEIPNELFSEATFSEGFVIPNTVKTISVRAFYGATFPINVIIPDSVTFADSYAFARANVPPGFSMSRAITFKIAFDRKPITFLDTKYLDGSPYSIVYR